MRTIPEILGWHKAPPDIYPIRWIRADGSEWIRDPDVNDMLLRITQDYPRARVSLSLHIDSGKWKAEAFFFRMRTPNSWTTFGDYPTEAVENLIYAIEKWDGWYGGNRTDESDTERTDHVVR